MLHSYRQLAILHQLVLHKNLVQSVQNIKTRHEEILCQKYASVLAKFLVVSDLNQMRNVSGKFKINLSYGSCAVLCEQVDGRSVQRKGRRGLPGVMRLKVT